jgi:hypothetical protein
MDLFTSEFKTGQKSQTVCLPAFLFPTYQHLPLQFAAFLASSFVLEKHFEHIFFSSQMFLVFGLMTITNGKLQVGMRNFVPL